MAENLLAMDIVQYVNQGDVWITRDGTFVKIEDMSATRRVAAARWLFRNCDKLHQAVIAACNEDVNNKIGTLNQVMSLVAQGSRAWIARTELFKRVLGDNDINAYIDIDRYSA